MEFVDVATEQTTAITDLINFFLAIALAYVILRSGHSGDRGRSEYWASVFILIGLASGLGAVTHGVELSENSERILWIPINLSLGLAVSIFLTVVILEMWGPSGARKSLPYLLAVGIGFFSMTLLIPGIFLLFIAYLGISTIFSLAVYIRLWEKRGDSIHKLMTIILSTSIIFSILFAVIRLTGSAKMRIIWEFDQNGFFHAAQSAAMIILALGIRSQLRSLEGEDHSSP